MTARDTLPALTCPGCGRRARVAHTRYGRRDSCDRCGVHSWDGKPLVTPAVHEARQAFHAAFAPSRTASNNRVARQFLLIRRYGRLQSSCSRRRWMMMHDLSIYVIAALIAFGVIETIGRAFDVGLCLGVCS